MKIVETNLKFKSLSPVGKVKYITLHHAASAGDLSARQIHNMHLNNGWAGIGYHYVVRQNGTIERGRPEHCIGAGVANHNTGNIHICFPGNFDNNVKMNPAQLEAGKELVAHLKAKYKAENKKHKDFGGTACPGKYFPYEEVVSGKAPTNPTNPPKPTSPIEKALWEKSIQGEEVKELQTELKVSPADGLFGDKTLAKCPLIKKGAKGNLVKIIQKRLLKRGYSLAKYGADGGFGDEMLSAVKRLQDCFSLTQDGIIGPNTWKALYTLDKGRF